VVWPWLWQASVVRAASAVAPAAKGTLCERGLAPPLIIPRSEVGPDGVETGAKVLVVKEKSTGAIRARGQVADLRRSHALVYEGDARDMGFVGKAHIHGLEKAPGAHLYWELSYVQWQVLGSLEARWVDRRWDSFLSRLRTLGFDKRHIQKGWWMVKQEEALGQGSGLTEEEVAKLTMESLASCVGLCVILTAMQVGNRQRDPMDSSRAEALFKGLVGAFCAGQSFEIPVRTGTATSPCQVRVSDCAIERKVAEQIFKWDGAGDGPVHIVDALLGLVKKGKTGLFHAAADGGTQRLRLPGVSTMEALCARMEASREDKEFWKFPLRKLPVLRPRSGRTRRIGVDLRASIMRLAQRGQALDAGRMSTAIMLWDRDDEAPSDFEEDADLNESTHPLAASPEPELRTVAKRSRKQRKEKCHDQWEFPVTWSFLESAKRCFAPIGSSKMVSLDGLNLGYQGEVLQMIVRCAEARRTAWAAPQVVIVLVQDG
jgi:hypothetical protein